MAEVIISILGAGLLGVLGLCFSSIKTDLRSLGARLDRSEAILVNLLERLTKIETVQEEHGRLLGQMMDHGERIAALEGRASAG